MDSGNKKGERNTIYLNITTQDDSTVEYIKLQYCNN
jgi:hypothetical protein